jgi:2-polyprenyl-6-methoxyphenol hydroxylase-like FAD-dependent oxidoreductase
MRVSLTRTRVIAALSPRPLAKARCFGAIASGPRSRAAKQADGAVVVGGGLAGLAAAAALTKVAGVKHVTVLERSSAAAFGDEQAGAAAQLGPNGLRALRFFGGEPTLAAVRSAGTELAGTAIHPAGGAATMLIPDSAQADTGLPQVMVRWGVLRAALANLLPEGGVVTGAGSDIAGYLLAGGGAVPASASGAPVAFDMGGRQAAIAAPLLVAADGLRSTFRPILLAGVENVQELGGAEAAVGGVVKDGGRTNIKAVVRQPLPPGFAARHTHAYFSPGGGLAVFAGPAGDGWTYWAMSIADGVAAPLLAAASPGRNLRAAQLSVFNQFASSLGCSEHGTQLLTNLISSEGNAAQFAADLIGATDPARILLQRSEEAIAVGPSLSGGGGHVVLVGDAAHGMSPAYGQAANFAMEDAAVLARCVRDAESLAEALQAYGEERVARCREMTARSAERAAKAMRGEMAEDVSKWIFEWDIDQRRQD